MYFFFFKQKTAYEMRISDWSSDVCSSDLRRSNGDIVPTSECSSRGVAITPTNETSARYGSCSYSRVNPASWSAWSSTCSPNATRTRTYDCRRSDGTIVPDGECRSEEHTSELQSLMRSSYAVF